MGKEFVAIDVETANADMSSICQVGLALFRGKTLVEEWETHIDPEDFFDGMNISIHGITEETVKGAPSLPLTSDTIWRFLDDRVSVCHTHFDRVAIRQAFQKYDLRQPRCRWLDSARIARRAWAEFSKSGYGLGNVCASLGYQFQPHDALRDAKAAAFVLNAAIEISGLDIEAWFRRVEQPVYSAVSGSATIRREGSAEGPLLGEVLVFTGALEIPRGEAADMAARIGCRVDSGVTSRTTILVVGDQDVRKLMGHEKSSKHRKVEALVAKGQSIRIIRETDFRQLSHLIQ